MEDLEDHLRAIEDVDTHLLLEVARLRRRQLVVDEQEVAQRRLGRADHGLQLFALAAAEVGAAVEGSALLRDRVDDGDAERARELAQLGQRALELLVGYIGQLHGSDDGALRLVFGVEHGYVITTRTSALRRRPCARFFCAARTGDRGC